MGLKLFVDDIRNAPDETWHVARTVEAAIKAIDVFDFEVISLDHDISHQVLMGTVSRPFPCDETFYPVALFIKEKYRVVSLPKVPKIILHTSNPAGAFRMSQALEGFDVTVKESRPANRLETEV